MSEYDSFRQVTCSTVSFISHKAHTPPPANYPVQEEACGPRMPCVLVRLITLQIIHPYTIGFTMESSNAINPARIRMPTGKSHLVYTAGKVTSGLWFTTQEQVLLQRICHWSSSGSIGLTQLEVVIQVVQV